MNNIIYYQFSNIIIQLNIDFEYDVSISPYSKFVVDHPEHCDYIFNLKYNPDIDFFNEKTKHFQGQLGQFHFYEDNQGDEYTLFTYKKVYHAITHIGEHEGYCFYVNQNVLFEEINNGNHLENYLCLHKILMLFQGYILHSCHIHYHDQAILFTAPSGTGKSTQGNLWNQYKDAVIINGDRTLIRKIDDKYYGCGIPFSGTSNICLNKQAKLSAIIIIRQAPYNKITNLRNIEKYKYLLSEITYASWNLKETTGAMNFVDDLIKNIPIYLLECTQYKEAVDTLYNQLIKDGLYE